MSERPLTVSLKLVTIICSSELEDGLVADMTKLGTRGHTISRVSGTGQHGPRDRNIWDMGNVRIEALVLPEIAARLLKHVVNAYPGRPVVAFTQEVEAVPRGHFVNDPEA